MRPTWRGASGCLPTPNAHHHQSIHDAPGPGQPDARRLLIERGRRLAEQALGSGCPASAPGIHALLYFMAPAPAAKREGRAAQDSISVSDFQPSILNAAITLVCQPKISQWLQVLSQAPLLFLRGPRGPSECQTRHGRSIERPSRGYGSTVA